MDKVTSEDLVETVMVLPTPASLFERQDDGNFRLVISNDSVKQLYKTDANPEGRSVGEFRFSDSANEQLKAAFDRCCETQEAYTQELRWRLRDGSVVYTNFTAVPLVEDGKVSRIITTSFDVTDLVLARMAHAESIRSLLSGYMSICAWCNSIHQDGKWVPADQYAGKLNSHHILCPDCASAKA